MKPRIYFLDNLRTFLVFLVILGHAGFVYQHGFEANWIVDDPFKRDSIGILVLYIDIFVMFCMFFISGYFMPDSLKNRNTWDFLKSKFKRIMLPWGIAVFTLIPIYKAIFLYSRGLHQEEWYSYFHLFQRTGKDLSFFANAPSQHWLWFLPVLFLFQVLYLSLSKTNILVINISLKTAVFLTFIIGFLCSMIISIYGIRGWILTPLLNFQKDRILIYFMAFLLGSLCNKLKVFESKDRNRKYLIRSNAVLVLALIIYTPVAINFFINIAYPSRNYFFVSNKVDRIVYYGSSLLSMLGFLYFIIDLFRFKYNNSNKLMDQLNINSYYVYIIHMIVLGVIALILVNIPISTFIKYLILALLTFIVSHLLIYAYRRIFQLEHWK